MRRSNFDFLSLAQDPLLTILALVLVGTVWLLLPTGRPAGDEKEQQLVSELEQWEARRAKLQQEWDALDSEAKTISFSLVRAEKATPKELEAQRAAQLEQLRRMVEERIAQLRQLEAERDLLKAQNQSRAAGADSARIASQIEALRQDLAAKEKELASLQVKFQDGRALLDPAVSGNVRAELAQLPAVINLKRSELQELVEEVEALNDFDPNALPRTFYSEKPNTVTFQLSGNKLYPIDDDHFEITVRGVVKVGKQDVSAVRFARRPKVSGDTRDELVSPQGKLQRALQKLDPARDRVVFITQSDSFGILRRALTVASRAGFEVGWWPDDSRSYAVYAGQGSAKVPSLAGANQ